MAWSHFIRYVRLVAHPVGYTGEWTDGPSGLHYDVARSYDTGVGQFASADTVNAGLDRYAYVGDNPETLSDPSGHCGDYQSDVRGGGSLGCGSGGCSTNCQPPCTSNCSNNPTNNNTTSTTTMSMTTKPKCDAQCQHDKAMKDLDKQAVLLEIGAGFAQIIGLIIGLLSKTSAIWILEGMLGVIDALNWVLPNIGKYLLDSGLDPSWYTGFLAATSAIDEIAGLVQTAMGWLKLAGWLMQTAINAVVFTVKEAATGIEGAVVGLAWSVFGQAATYIINGASDEMLALAQATLAQENHQSNMDINAWCQQYGNGCPNS